MQATHSENFVCRYSCMASITFAAILAIVFYRFYTQSLFFGMQQPIVFTMPTELIYRIVFKSGVVQWLTGSVVISFFADVLMLVLPIVFIITRERIFAVATFATLLIYFLSYNMVTGHHYHGLVGALVVAIPFFTKNETKFLLLWQTARYYLLYIFVSAALWKILRGTAFLPEQLSNILKAQQLPMLLQEPDSFNAQIVRCLIVRPEVSHILLLLNVLVQSVFLVGFFTKKFDSVLLWLAILFCAANYFVMNIVSAELLVLGVTLLNMDKCAAIFSRFSALNSDRLALKQP